MSVPEPTPIYHVTHRDNLPGILGTGGLVCYSDLRAAGTDVRDVANQEIQSDRGRKTDHG